ncbi:MAG: tRNA (adenine-N1)-methyltransferase [Actinomycetota bacterium]|nr:tRNA (adenine-N1)-methyltransferase [Actinomycetota bacterium]
MQGVGLQPGGGPFRPGDTVMLVDSKNRTRLVTLATGRVVHSHSGVLPHDRLLGGPDGSIVRSDTGARFVAVRPRLADLVIGMPRGAQVIYPKDLAAIVMAADVHPGCKVLEAGVGSGALSMALLRSGADVVGYEIRDDFAARASSNVSRLLGDTAPYRVRQKDVYAGIDERDLDRVLLDLPEPWRVVGHAETALRPGGILLCYLPSVVQVAEMRERLDRSRFGLAETVEILERSWHVAGKAVRPDHRMVGHTGFLTYARLLTIANEPRTGADGEAVAHARLTGEGAEENGGGLTDVPAGTPGFEAGGTAS